MDKIQELKGIIRQAQGELRAIHWETQSDQFAKTAMNLSLQNQYLLFRRLYLSAKMTTIKSVLKDFNITL